MRWPACVLLAMAAAPTPTEARAIPVRLRQDTPPERAHVELYRKVSPAVVGVREGNALGSGVFIHPRGWIVTSTTAIPANATEAFVYYAGGRRTRAKVIRRVHALDLVILRAPIRSPAVVPLGDSGRVRVGRVVYVLGDTFGSIFNDDEVAVSMGVVSGIYEIRKPQGRSRYRGPAIETTAAVNPHLDGGPLVDREGRLLGLVSLNYEPSRFLGIAVPAHLLRAEVASAVQKVEGEPWLGWTLAFGENGARVERVIAGGPAERAGIREGDLVREAGYRAVSSAEGYAETLRTVIPDVPLEVVIERDGERRTVEIPVEGRSAY